MIRPLAMVLAAGAALFGATAANAETHWSFGINLPIVVQGGDSYAEPPAPVYYQPAPVVQYAPVPRSYRYLPPPVVYQAPEEYVEPQVVYQVPYRGWRGAHDNRSEEERRFEHARWERNHERNRWERDDHEHGRDGREWHRD